MASLGNRDARYDFDNWFLIALQADANNEVAYQKYAHGLLPRWFGSHEKMFEVARALIRSKRYDTYAPLGGIYVYFRALFDQNESSPLLIFDYFKQSPDSDYFIKVLDQILSNKNMAIYHSEAASYASLLSHFMGKNKLAMKYGRDASLWNLRYYLYRTYSSEQAERIIKELKGG